MELDEEGAAAPKMRWLAILGGPHPPLDQAPDLGPLAELGDSVELHVLRSLTLDALAAAVKEFGPTAVYAYGGSPGRSEDVERQSVAPLGLLLDDQGAVQEAAVEAFAAVFAGLGLDVLFLDFAGSAAVASALRRVAGSGEPAARHVIAWPASTDPPALAALDFAHCFLGLLRSPAVSVPEAYTLAAHMAKSHGTVMGAGDASAQEPAVPQLLAVAAGSTAADAAANGAQPAVLAPQQPALPATASVPAPELEGVDLSKGMSAAFPGYSDLRLLAPNAELRLLQAGISSMVNHHNLRFLGEALRALLTLEVRQLELAQLVQLGRPPAHLPSGTSAVRCDVRTPSGATATVTLGGPADLLKNKALVQHALRQALAADAQTLQFKLPPAGVPLPPTHMSPGVASGAPVVEGLAVASLWTVQLLKLLAQDSAYRGLVLLGVAAVGTSPVVAFGPGDAARLAAVVTQNDPSKAQAPPGAAVALPDAPPAAARPPRPSAAAAAAAAAQTGPHAMEGVEAAAGGLTPAGSNAAAVAAARGGSAGPGSSGRSGSGGRAAAPAASPPELTSGAAAAANEPAPIAASLQQEQADAAATAAAAPLPWKSSRPPLPMCSEKAFMSDLIAFLTERQGRQIDPRTFPEAILNGSKLDLFHLYKEVCSRGGFKVGNGINWKGQVFPRMRNFTPNHRMTGVGNALKRHYQVFLLEYEQVHPDDITGDRCGICGRGDEHASDWISCDGCDTWVHFSCDERMSRAGTFKDYAKGKGRSYHCPRCNELRQQRAMQDQAAAEAAAQAAQTLLAQVLAAAVHVEGSGPAPMQEIEAVLPVDQSAAAVARRSQAGPSSALPVSATDMQQLFTRHPLLLRRLRRLLQLAIPSAVAADTARSCYVTYQLAQQRFQEWEAEDNEETHREVRHLLERVVRRCAKADPDFWPPGVTTAVLGSSGSSDTEPRTAASGDIWALLGLDGNAAAEAASASSGAAALQAADGGGAAASAIDADAAGQFAEQEAAQLLRFQSLADERAQQEAGGLRLATLPAAASQQAQRGAQVVVVTLNEALAHVASNIASLELPWSTLMAPPPGVVHVTLSDVVHILGSTRPARVARTGKSRLQARILAAADATRDSLRSSGLPWPQMQLSRKSALRCAVDWRGMNWPAAEPEPLERDLACC